MTGVTNWIVKGTLWPLHYTVQMAELFLSVIMQAWALSKVVPTSSSQINEKKGKNQRIHHIRFDSQAHLQNLLYSEKYWQLALYQNDG